jgi:hypothetical protein
MENLFKELGTLSPGTLSIIVSVIGAIGAILGATIAGIIGKVLVTPFLGARDRQDREIEWRKHAIELTKLDLDRKLKTRAATDTTPLRPSILDFLANYRDLQELGVRTPKDLYNIIKANRITTSAPKTGTTDANLTGTGTGSGPSVALLDGLSNLSPAGIVASSTSSPERGTAKNWFVPPIVVPTLFMFLIVGRAIYTAF